MKKIICFIAAALTCQCLTAQEKEFPVWPENTPNEVHLQKGKSVEEKGNDNVTRILSQPIPTLQRFPAKSGTRSKVCVATNKPASTQDKVIIICPGGGYSILAIDLEGTEIAQWLNSLGYTAYILRYRVPKDREGALQDAQRAIRIVRHQNPGKKIGIMGFSAGASLSARAATRSQAPSYTPIDEIDKESCRPDFCGLIYPAYLDEGPNHTLTPELTLDENTPRCFIFQTAVDPYGNSAFVFGQALRFHKIPVELHVYPTGAHGYGLRTKLAKAGGIWPKLMATWLKTF